MLWCSQTFNMNTENLDKIVPEQKIMKNRVRESAYLGF